jgi:hypothetical protein
MKGKFSTTVVFFISLFSLNTTAQGVYLKDIKHLGISCILLGNDKIGVVVPNSHDGKSPQNLLPLAPVQAIRFTDGSFSDPELNFLEGASDVRECSVYPFTTDGYGGKEIPVKKRTLSIIKQTSSEISIAIQYTFSKPENKGTHDSKGQQGYYTCTLTLKAGEPLVMIEEETDVNFSYRFEAGRNMFQQARYRGRYSNSVEEGYMLVNGQKQIYKNENEFPGREAIVDLPYDTPIESCKPYHHYPAIAQWNIWPTGTGWYWQLHSAAGGALTPTVGIFHGKASRLTGSSCAQVNFFTRSDNRAAGVRINILRTNPARYYSRLIRFQWGIYLGAKQADILPPDQASPILKWFNRKSGLAEKIVQFEKQPPIAAAEFEWGAFYQDKNAVQQMIQKTRSDAAFTRLLSEQDNNNTSLFNAWSGNACSAAKIFHTLKTHYETFKELAINGQGIYSFSITKKFTGECREKEITTDDGSYLRASDWFRRDVLVAGALMAAAKAGAVTLTNAQKDSLKMFSGVYARVLWDDDFVPMAYPQKETEATTTLDHGVNYGQINMYVTYQSGRDFFALLYRNDPNFKTRYEGTLNRCKKTIGEIINEYGASTASPHYTEPTLESLILLLLQLKQQGINLFETEPRLAAFARFYLNLLTPPSVRFAGNRKLTSFGDGSEESAALFGLLATGFRSSKAGVNELSDDLDRAYRNGPMRSLPKAGIMTLVYDYSKPEANRPYTSLKNISVPGYLSHFRSQVNTPLETAIWLLNGNYYYDHRGDDDGELSMYALRAPLSLSRSSFYDPYANAATTRSMVIPYKDFTGWSSSQQPISYGNQFKRTWNQSELTRYTGFNYTGYASATMGKKDTWQRELIFFQSSEQYPLIIIRDILNNREPHIWSMPFFSEGNIQLPGRTMVNTAPPGNCVIKNQLPDAALVNGKTEWPLQSGWNRFSFTGQEWRNYDPQKNVNGIDWWLYSYNHKNETKASFTEWTNFYIPGPEMQEFEKTHPHKFNKACIEKNPSIHYRETQQLLRLKGSEHFLNIIMPFRKGEAPLQCDVQPSGENGFTIIRTINNVKETIEVTAGGITLYSAQKTIISSFGAAAVSNNAAQISLSGGVAELVLDAGNKMSITAPLNSGNRVIALPPGNWKMQEPPLNVSVALSGNKLTLLTGKDNGNISHTSGEMATVVLIRK